MQRKERKKKKTKQLVEGGGEVFLSINVITYTNIAVAKSAHEKDVKRKKKSDQLREEKRLGHGSERWILFISCCFTSVHFSFVNSAFLIKS